MSSNLRERWLKWTNEQNHAGHRLVCFGHAGSTYSDFASWGAHLGPQVEVVAVSLPGRCERIDEEPRCALSPMADEIAEAVCELPARPTTLFGHSFGSILAYEVAQRILVHDRDRLKSVVISASGLSPVTALDGIDENNEDDVLKAFVERGYLSTEHLENSKLIELVLPYLTADILCKRGWLPDVWPLLDAPIHSFAWSHDHLVRPEIVNGWHTKSSLPDLCKHFVFGGGHLQYLSRPPTMFTALNNLILQDHLDHSAYLKDRKFSHV